MNCCNKICKGLKGAVPWGIGSAAVGSVLGIAARASLGYKSVTDITGAAISFSSGGLVAGSLWGFILNIGESPRYLPRGELPDPPEEEAYALLPVYTGIAFAVNALVGFGAAQLAGHHVAAYGDMSIGEAFAASGVETAYAVAIGIIFGVAKCAYDNHKASPSSPQDKV